MTMTTNGNVITSQKTYATVANATKALDAACVKLGTTKEKVRWLIALTPDGSRYVPTVVGEAHLEFVHVGVMVVG
jgi:hypothetical protein